MKVLKTFIILQLLLCVGIIQAQKTIDIKIDFSNRTISPIPEIKVGDYYRIEINNINQNLYKVSLNTKDSLTLKKLETPTFGNVKIDELSSLVANLTSITSSAQDKAESVNKDVNSIFDFDISQYLAKNNEKLITKRINSEKKLLSNYLAQQQAIISDIDKLKYSVAKLQLYYFDDTNVISNNGFNLSTAITDIQNYRQGIDALKNTIKASKSKYVDVFYKTYVDDINKKQEFKVADKSIKESYNKFETALNKVFESINSENAISLLKSIVFLKDKTLKYVSLPIQFNGDKASIKLKFEPKKEDFNLQTFEMPLLFPAKEDNYWSIGVSFFGSSLHSERFSSISEPVTDSTQVYRLVEEEKQKNEIGIATLLRFGTKFKAYPKDDAKKLGFHGTIGPGISIEEKIKPRLLLGAGFSYGSKHNIALDFGLVLGYVDRKSNAFNLEETYLEKPTDITVSRLSVGGFISIGYLFTL